MFTLCKPDVTCVISTLFVRELHSCGIPHAAPLLPSLKLPKVVKGAVQGALSLVYVIRGVRELSIPTIEELRQPTALAPAAWHKQAACTVTRPAGSGC